MTVRAKFRCNYIAEGKGNWTIHMSPVYSDDPASENKFFTDATPAGTFQMVVTKEEAAKAFEVGKNYYLDFTKAA
jgi:hypothetical protein